MLGDFTVALVALLIFESDGYCIRFGQVRGTVVENSMVLNELKISDANRFGAPLRFVGYHFEIFAAAHSKEETQ